jgi:hypothetical protein
MADDCIIDRLWNEWLDERQPVVTLGGESISNRERYEDILEFMELAFHAGFEAKLIYSSQEQLQK